MGDATTILSLAVAVIVIITAIVKLQANLFDKMAKMMHELVENHSNNSGAHPDLREMCRSQKLNLEAFKESQDDRWREHEKWGEEAVNKILGEMRNHKT